MWIIVHKKILIRLFYALIQVFHLYIPTDTPARYTDAEFIVLLQDTNLHRTIKAVQEIQLNISDIQYLHINSMTQKPMSLSIGFHSITINI